VSPMQIRSIDVSGTAVSGSLPADWPQAASLSSVNVTATKLDGPVPTSWLMRRSTSHLTLHLPMPSLTEPGLCLPYNVTNDPVPPSSTLLLGDHDALPPTFPVCVLHVTWTSNFTSDVACKLAKVCAEDGAHRLRNTTGVAALSERVALLPTSMSTQARIWQLECRARCGPANAMVMPLTAATALPGGASTLAPSSGVVNGATPSVTPAPALAPGRRLQHARKLCFSSAAQRVLQQAPVAPATPASAQDGNAVVSFVTTGQTPSDSLGHALVAALFPEAITAADAAKGQYAWQVHDDVEQDSASIESGQSFAGGPEAARGVMPVASKQPRLSKGDYQSRLSTGLIAGLSSVGILLLLGLIAWFAGSRCRATAAAPHTQEMLDRQDASRSSKITGLSKEISPTKGSTAEVSVGDSSAPQASHKMGFMMQSTRAFRREASRSSLCDDLAASAAPSTEHEASQGPHGNSLLGAGGGSHVFFDVGGSSNTSAMLGVDDHGTATGDVASSGQQTRRESTASPGITDIQGIIYEEDEEDRSGDGAVNDVDRGIEVEKLLESRDDAAGWLTTAASGGVRAAAGAHGSSYLTAEIYRTVTPAEVQLSDLTARAGYSESSVPQVSQTACGIGCSDSSYQGSGGQGSKATFETVCSACLLLHLSFLTSSALGAHPSAPLGLQRIVWPVTCCLLVDERACSNASGKQAKAFGPRHFWMLAPIQTVRSFVHKHAPETSFPEA
jgi:hypothetical protein